MPNLIARRLARLLLAAMLLAGQQIALAHQIWHFAAAPAQQAAGIELGEPGEPRGANAGGKSLCDLHMSLGTVLGALGCAPAVADFAAPRTDAVPGVVLVSAPAAPLPPSSRDPPSLR